MVEFQQFFLLKFSPLLLKFSHFSLLIQSFFTAEIHTLFTLQCRGFGCRLGCLLFGVSIYIPQHSRRLGCRNQLRPGAYLI
jgi:hypothetical protein